MNGRAPVVLLWTSTGVSAFATAVALLVVPWFVLALMGSAMLVGAVAAVEMAGLVALAAVGGPLVDRLGARRSAIGSDLAAAVVLVAIPLLHNAFGLVMWQLFALAALLGASRAPGQTARRAVAPDLFERAGMPVERGSGGLDAANRCAQMLGAPLGGAALAAVSETTVLLAVGMLFALAAGLTALGVPRGRAGRSNGGYLADLRAGARALLGDRLLVMIVLVLLVMNTLDMAAIGVLHPIYAAEVLRSPVALGAMSGVLAAAALLGNLGYSWLGPRLPRRFVLVTAIAGAPRYAVMALEPGLPVLLIVIAVAGLASGAINPTLSVLSYERVDPAMRGRVLGLSGAVAFGGAPLGALVDGVGWGPRCGPPGRATRWSRWRWWRCRGGGGWTARTSGLHLGIRLGSYGDRLVQAGSFRARRPSDPGGRNRSRG
ncbi:Predicted arabinose efflux permease, MFS family [Saccharopolyspora kobensis]|uniref:Multidrug efflux pump Tap n=1 Tax=Saccharopolyspora kobensis TaxID=146035 RepID=A0A1H5TEP7_9PSEU|nr:MFS transporter [Saccharopolyspora kobensis]SEF61312.1 Predicted arabinose efflux permease, MFS family [Saccharopolyspora kobensis]SFC47157.1 Predicted arabinose efflux permease, MFS family [Saccharopolyspora kobensis]